MRQRSTGLHESYGQTAKMPSQSKISLQNSLNKSEWTGCFSSPGTVRHQHAQWLDRHVVLSWAKPAREVQGLGTRVDCILGMLEENKGFAVCKGQAGDIVVLLCPSLY